MIREVFSNIDVLACSSTIGPAYPVTTEMGCGPLDDSGPIAFQRYTVPYDYNGAPTLSVPCGLSGEGLPLSIRESGNEAIAVEADIGDIDDINRVVEETLNAFVRIDILVNNAGVTRFSDIMDLTVEDWDRIHRVNARGVFFCLQRVAREMIYSGDGGRIINIASIAGKGYSGTSNAVYAASKGAVISMTHIAAFQLGGHDINVNAICPGVTRTAMSQSTMIQRSQNMGIPMEELEERRSAQIPIGRANEPEDIADMAVFLAGPGSRNITGQRRSMWMAAW